MNHSKRMKLWKNKWNSDEDVIGQDQQMFRFHCAKRYVQRTSLKKVLSFFFCGPCAVCVKTSVRSHSVQILRSGIKPPGDRSLRNWSWNVICCHRTKLFSLMPVNHHGHFCPQAPQTSYRLVLLQDKGQSSGSQLVPPNPEALGGPGLQMRI